MMRGLTLRIARALVAGDAHTRGLLHAVQPGLLAWGVRVLQVEATRRARLDALMYEDIVFALGLDRAAYIRTKNYAGTLEQEVRDLRAQLAQKPAAPPASGSKADRRDLQ